MSESEPALITATKHGLGNIVDELLHLHTSIEVNDDTGKSALMHACILGHVNIAKSLLQYAVKNKINIVDHLDVKKYSALYYATIYDQREIVLLLLQYKPNLSLSYGRRHNILHVAIDEQRTVMVDILLLAGMDVNATDSAGQSAILWAAKCGQYDTMVTLLRHGADVNQYDCHGFSAIYLVVLYADCEMLQLLLRHHAEINKSPKDGYNAVMTAALRQHQHKVQLLLQAGATFSEYKEGRHDKAELASAKHLLVQCKLELRVNEMNTAQKNFLQLIVDKKPYDGVTPYMLDYLNTWLKTLYNSLYSIEKSHFTWISIYNYLQQQQLL